MIINNSSLSFCFAVKPASQINKRKMADKVIDETADLGDRNNNSYTPEQESAVNRYLTPTLTYRSKTSYYLDSNNYMRFANPL